MQYFYDKQSGHHIIKDAQINFPNFEGREDGYNQAGRRNFRLQIPEELYRIFKEQGVYTKERVPVDETEPTMYFVKVGVYPSSEIQIYSGKALRELDREDFGMIDEEYRRGHVKKADVEFHASINTRVSNGIPYVRLDTAVFTIGRSKLLDEYEEAMSNDDEAPF